jgi:hypothetical protein
MAKSKKASTHSKGNYYKVKTRKYFEDLGYHVEYLEKFQRIYTPKGVLNIKRDLLASDGMAMNKERMIFWQSKLTKHNVADAITQFKKLPFPPTVECWIVVWTTRVKEPEIIQVREDDVI